LPWRTPGGSVPPRIGSLKEPAIKELRLLSYDLKLCKIHARPEQGTTRRNAELLRFQISRDTTPCCVVNSYCDLENEGRKAHPKRP
jgi:hypothetical protein